MPDKPLYLVLTHKFGDWMERSISSLGRFDVETGRYPGDDVLARYRLEKLDCRPSSGTTLRCRNGVIDVGKGTMNGNPNIGEVVVVRNGFLANSERNNNTSPWKLVIQVTDDGSSHYALMHEENWNSNFSQLFHRGSFDPKRLELVLDRYPLVRIYRIIR